MLTASELAHAYGAGEAHGDYALSYGAPLRDVDFNGYSRYRELTDELDQDAWIEAFWTAAKAIWEESTR